MSARAQELEAAVQVAEAAGPIALRYFRLPIDVQDKSGGGAFDPVTRADREVEAFVRAELTRRFPADGLVGEEEAPVRPDAARRWVIDPIDGTKAFISGMPAWGILLGLEEEERPAVGVIHQPFLGESFCGDGEAAWLRQRGAQRELHARATERVEEAILYCTHPSMFDRGGRAAFDRVAGEARLLRYGGDCYAYALLALGQVDLVIEACLQPYDIIPLIPILEGAGARVTTWAGEPARAGGHVVAAATPALHAAVLERLANEVG